VAENLQHVRQHTGPIKIQIERKTGKANYNRWGVEDYVGIGGDIHQTKTIYSVKKQTIMPLGNGQVVKKVTKPGVGGCNLGKERKIRSTGKYTEGSTKDRVEIEKKGVEGYNTFQWEKELVPPEKEPYSEKQFIPCECRPL